MGEWFKQNVENSITAKVKMNKLLINMVNFPKPKKKKKKERNLRFSFQKDTFGYSEKNELSESKK